ncbi:MAG: integration host factor subunit beta [Succinivibrionaceae bacterium]|nr:integration host factor subunit beta [Succinivibrionaceae bacterium]
MNKLDLVEILADSCGIEVENFKLEQCIDEIFNFISQEVSAGRKIEIRGFGCFSQRKRPSRMARNPKTGEKVLVPDRYVIFFKPGKELKDRLNADDPADPADLAGDPETSKNPTL